jgi:hypothetical protein
LSFDPKLFSLEAFTNGAHRIGLEALGDSGGGNRTRGRICGGWLVQREPIDRTAQTANSEPGRRLKWPNPPLSDWRRTQQPERLGSDYVEASGLTTTMEYHIFNRFFNKHPEKKHFEIGIAIHWYRIHSGCSAGNRGWSLGTIVR